MKHLAIFGGTFNPVHNGHCAIAKTAIMQAGLDQVIWVPAFNPPHKTHDGPTFGHRLAMVERAIAANPGFVVFTADQESQGASYAIGTLRTLQAAYPDAIWYWILGVDSLQSLPRWYGRDDLIQTLNWVVAPRYRAGEAQFDQLVEGDGTHVHQVCERVARAVGGGLRWRVLQMPPVEISSSQVRQYCREGRSIAAIVPDPVRIYIEAQKLYTK